MNRAGAKVGTYSSSNMRRRWTASMPASGASAMVEMRKDGDDLAGRREGKGFASERGRRDAKVE